LSQIHLKVPPLRERPEDIAGLAELFLQQQDPRYRFSPAAIDKLCHQVWSGNVRELRNVVSKSLIFANEFTIGPSDLELAEDTVATAPDVRDAAVSLERLERKTIFKALEQVSGHHQKAAELLGISRRTLTRRLKVYGMNEARETSVA
jgi:DNA-binding NtrC family response regulator